MSNTHYLPRASSQYYAAARYERYIAELEPFLVSGWDGEEAQPISVRCLSAFNEVVKAFPFDVQDPEIGADIDDGIVLRWMSKDRYVTITVSGDRAIEAYREYAGERLHAVVHMDLPNWQAELSPFLSCVRQEPWPMPFVVLAQMTNDSTVYTSTHRFESKKSEYVTA